VADFEWDLQRYDWPREGVLRWWAQCWDWDSLARNDCPHPDYKTYGEYYAPTFKFHDPRVKDNPPDITEENYWGERWRTNFAGKEWDIYHLPTFDPETGALGPKHGNYEGDDKWSDADREAFSLGLRARMRAGKAVRLHYFGNKIDGPDTRVPLSGIVTTRNTDLSLPGETVHVDFSDALFGSGCRFSRADDEGDARHTRFGAATCFASVQFGGKADFASVQFGNKVNFTAAQFGDEANFTSAQFESLANFILARFGDGAQFRSARFDGAVYFRSVQFGDWAQFRSARFCGEADFSLAQFGDEANFTHARFGILADFTSAQFDDRALFTNALFGDVAKFDFARFLGNVYFSLDNGRDNLAFRSICFKGVAFWGDVDFTNRRFAEPADFTDAKFYGAAIFHNAALHEGVKFTTSDETFFPAPGQLPRISGDEATEHPQLSAALESIAGERERLEQARATARRKLWIRAIRKIFGLAVDKLQTDAWTQKCYNFEQAYRRLKILMQQQGARNEEQFFHALEIKSRMKRLDIPWLEKPFADLYGAFSNYGQSVTRPVVWLGAFAIFFFMLMCLLSGWSGLGWFTPAVMSQAGAYLIRNLVPGLWLRDLTVGGGFLAYQFWIDKLLMAHKFIFLSIATLHAILNLVLWFLLALALRRRFRIG
jgi:hypothetical protein